MVRSYCVKYLGKYGICVFMLFVLLDITVTPCEKGSLGTCQTAKVLISL